jgi:hypothetical protein
MKKLLLVAALALTCAGIAAPRANAQSAQFTFTPISSISNVAPGQSIQFSINLVVMTGGTLNNVQGLTYFLQQNGAGPYVFTITGRDNERTADPADDSFFNDEISTNSQIFANNPQLNPSNGRDLGALADNPLPSGTYFIANITLTLAGNAAPGSYTIQSVTTGGKTAVVNNSNGDTFPIQPGSLTITVVPEPSTYALLAFGAIGAGIVVYRRRAIA